MSDFIKKFLLEDRSARVSAVELENVWHEALLRQDCSAGVQTLLGELMGAAALLTSGLKFEGSLLLQLQGHGPVRLIVVECRADMTMRATVKSDNTQTADQSGLKGLINPDGQGRFSVIVNPPKTAATMHPYQGIVSADTDSVSQAIEQYMLQSEQLPTHLWLSVTPKRIHGLMLQRLASAGGQSEVDSEQAESSWEQARALCSTLTLKELTETPIDTLLERLFWSVPVLSLETKPLTWHCGCNRERVTTMLQSLGREEVQDILDKEDVVEVKCEFCGECYRFNQKQVEPLFEQTMPDLGLDDSTLH